ncbi:tannase/feruloyl esterase family alpha/beta hydrolase [Thermomicrobium sp. 4228-Ro]|uniref:tannase/feruloyl esterase family alpha/beta hydrolase n=1 Tax=Thermomicrobium sp. 4228-Ro TaxID=2993937 RepID=UPI0022498358|nr:tannase/feruloyl esterase family alpha/beta hydrolase [Thermomicrobium sp. 4228-Ro]MCX2728010.1 tannase/feruloyl esterase family alpha/beta hydrolase [Thermomicrobium sp. 4228-Ro]
MGEAGPERRCAALAGLSIPAPAIALPTRGARVEQAEFVPSDGRLPAYCRVEGVIEPVDATAPPIRFRVNLPARWNGRALHFGGGGYNGFVPTGTDPVPGSLPDVPVPLARGYATFASDSGHVGMNAAFALNDEALENFGYAALKKTHDVAVTLLCTFYGAAPERVYFTGLSQGGREALTVAQRFPDDYDGVLSIVPVVNFTLLQLAGNRMGRALRDGGWMDRERIHLLAQAQRAACGGPDAVLDGLLIDYAACTFDPAALRCTGDRRDGCLTDAQLAAVRLFRSRLELEYPLANGVRSYPGWPVGNEDLPGGWDIWVMGPAPPPPVQPEGVDPGGSIIVNFGAQFVRYAIVRDPTFQTYEFDPNDLRWRERIVEVSHIVDSTDPDLSRFATRGGKLILVEYMADYAQSPYAGIEYLQRVVETLGAETVDAFARLYVVPGANHGGGNAPSRADWLTVLAQWVEQGIPPAEDLVLSQTEPVARTLPACRYPNWPVYQGGDPNDARSYLCRPARGFLRER